MSIPRTILPGLSHMARSVLLVAYAVADEDGEARGIFRSFKTLGQGKRELSRSVSELVVAELVKYERGPKGEHYLTLLEWGS